MKPKDFVLRLIDWCLILTLAVFLVVLKNEQ